MPTVKKQKKVSKLHTKKNAAKHTSLAPKHLVVDNPKAVKVLQNAMKTGRVIVLYHAEWCGACKAFMPEWLKFVAVMKNKPEIDCMTAEVESANLGLLPEAGIQGFPTVRYYNSSMEPRAPSIKTEQATGLAALFGLADNARANKEQAGTDNGIDYNGDRTSNALLEYVVRNSKKQSEGAAKQKHAKKAKSSDDAVFTEIIKKGFDPKKLTPVFKRQYRRLERASKHAKETIKEIRHTLGFKNKHK